MMHPCFKVQCNILQPLAARPVDQRFTGALDKRLFNKTVHLFVCTFLATLKKQLKSMALGQWTITYALWGRRHQLK